mgnify:CR=1 FL=1
MNKIKDQVSVILPTYNREKFLKRAVEDILNSSYEDIQLIVVNDGSTDSTPEILNEFSKDIVIIELENNSGTVCVPRNIGISYSTGEFLVHADDDVITHKDKFSILVDAIKNDKDNVLSYGDRIDRHSDGREVYQKIPNWNPLSATGVDNGQILYKSRVYKDVDFSWVYRACDWASCKKFYRLGKFEYVNLPVSTYLWHDDNRSIKTNGKYPKDEMSESEINKFAPFINNNYFNNFLDD